MPEHRLPHISVVIPLHNERENIADLVLGLDRALTPGQPWEAVLVDDGSSDGTAELLREIAQRDSRIRVIRLARNYGQTTALQAGFDHARGRVIVSMDGDLQNDPEDIPRLVLTLEVDDYDLVAGYREERKDPLSRRLPSRMANLLVRAITGVPIRDTGCTLRAYRRELLTGFVIYSDLHRFIPGVAAGLRGARITEVPVAHRPRRHGRSKYGLARAPRVMTDLLVLSLIRSFRERPLQMFARGAGLCLLAAMVAALPAILETIEPGPMVSLILPALPLVWLELGCFLLLLGLMCEVVLRWHRTRRPAPAPMVRQA